MPTGTNSFITDPSNNVATVAPLGNVYTNETFPILMASYHMNITGASGGTNLPNVPCGKVRIQNLSGNGVMWVGGVGQSAPYSGRGNELFDLSTVAGAQGETMYVNNANQISVCADLSGQLISFMAYGNSTTTVISPSTQGTAPNETQPVLSGTTPAANSTNNPFNTVVTYTFNIPMDPNNISGLYVVTSGQANPQLLGHLGGVLTYFSGSTQATFAPNSGQYQLSGWYIPMVDPSVNGYNGISLSGAPPFGTGGVTTSGNPFQIQGPPIVSGWSPSSGTSNYSGQTIITIFSQPMLSGSINISGIFMLLSGTTSPHISGMVNLLATNSGTQAAFSPISGTVATNSWYNIFVNNNTKDQFGNPLFISGGGSLLSGAAFQTAVVIPPDTTPPVVSGTNPVSGATNVLVIPNIQLIMSKSINSGFVTTSTVKVHDIQTSDINVAGTVSLQSDLITIDWTPNSPLGNLDLHRMELSGIKDLAGNFMTPFSGATFTVEPVLQVSGSTPASGATSVSIGTTMQLTMDRAVLSGTVNTTTCKLVDKNNSALTLSTVSLTSDNLTIAFTAAGMGYLAPYTYEISGIVDINNQQFMVPFSGTTFTTIAPSLTQVYNVASGSAFIANVGGATTNNSSFTQAGETFTSNSSPMFGKNIRQAQVIMQRVGNPTGTVNIVVADSSNTTRTALGSIPATSVSTSYTLYTFTNLSGNSSIGTNWNVFVDYSQGTSSDYINVAFNNGNSYSSTEGVVYQNISPTGYYGLNGSRGTPVADLCGTFSY